MSDSKRARDWMLFTRRNEARFLGLGVIALAAILSACGGEAGTTGPSSGAVSTFGEYSVESSNTAGSTQFSAQLTESVDGRVLAHLTGTLDSGGVMDMVVPFAASMPVRFDSSTTLVGANQALYSAWSTVEQHGSGAHHGEDPSEATTDALPCWTCSRCGPVTPTQSCCYWCGGSPACTSGLPCSQ